MRIDDGRQQARKFRVDLFAAGRIVHLDPVPLARDEPSLAQRLEVLRQGGLGNRAIAQLEERRAGLRTLGAGDLGKDVHADRVRQGMQYAFDRNVVRGRVHQGSHGRLSSISGPRLSTAGHGHSSLIMNLRTYLFRVN